MNWRRKMLAQFTKNYRTFYLKIVIKLSKIWVWDLGSGIRDPGSGKTYSGSRILVQGSKMHRIPDPDPQHCPNCKRLKIFFLKIFSTQRNPACAS